MQQDAFVIKEGTELFPVHNANHVWHTRFKNIIPENRVWCCVCLAVSMRYKVPYNSKSTYKLYDAALGMFSFHLWHQIPIQSHIEHRYRKTQNHKRLVFREDWLGSGIMNCVCVLAVDDFAKTICSRRLTVLQRQAIRFEQNRGLGYKRFIHIH